jgi:hypothetical protein
MLTALKRQSGFSSSVGIDSLHGYGNLWAHCVAEPVMFGSLDDILLLRLHGALKIYAMLVFRKISSERAVNAQDT